MSINNLVCSKCQAEVQTDTDILVHDKEETRLCEPCYRQSFNKVSQILIYEHKTPSIKNWSFNSMMGLPYDENGEELGDDDMKSMPLKDFAWVYTEDGTFVLSNGRRGYYQHKLRKGYIMVNDGFTDRLELRWKGLIRNHWLNHLMNDLFEENRIHPPCDLFCVISPAQDEYWGNNTSLVVRSRDEKTFVQWLESDYGLTKEELDLMAGTFKKVAKKKKEKSTNNNMKQPQEQLTGYQKEILYMKQVFESVGLPTSALERTETRKKQQDPTISVTFLNDFRNSRLK